LSAPLLKAIYEFHQVKHSQMAAKLLLPGLLLFFFACESTLKREFTIAMSGEDLHLAREYVGNALASDPSNPEALYLMGKIHVKERNYTEAKSYFERSLDAAPSFGQEITHLLESSYRREFNAGNSAWEQGQFETAIRHLDAAIQIFPDRWEPYPVKGEAHKYLGQYPQARQAFQNCVSVPRMQRFCSTNLAISYFRNGQFQEAKRTARQYLALFPEDRNLLKIAAYASLETGNIADGEALFSRYIKAGATYDAILQFATELNNKGEIYVAERFFTLCLKSNPNDKTVLAALSSIYLETGNFDLMVQANERLLLLDPDNTGHKEMLLLAYELAGDIESYKMIQSELDLNP